MLKELDLYLWEKGLHRNGVTYYVQGRMVRRVGDEQFLHPLSDSLDVVYVPQARRWVAQFLGCRDRDKYPMYFIGGTEEVAFVQSLVEEVARREIEIVNMLEFL